MFRVQFRLHLPSIEGTAEVGEMFVEGEDLIKALNDAKEKKAGLVMALRAAMLHSSKTFWALNISASAFWEIFSISEQCTSRLVAASLPLKMLWIPLRSSRISTAGAWRAPKRRNRLRSRQNENAWRIGWQRIITMRKR